MEKGPLEVQKEQNHCTKVQLLVQAKMGVYNKTENIYGTKTDYSFVFVLASCVSLYDTFVQLYATAKSRSKNTVMLGDLDLKKT
jgi:hypothetical protein